MRRWVWLVILAFVAAWAQTTVGQALWLRTSLGWIGPDLLLAAAMLMALRSRRLVDAALTGWVFGLAMDLTVSGPGMGLLAMLYAGGGAGVFKVRGAFYHDRPSSQIVLVTLLGVFVYEGWTLYHVVFGTLGAAGAGRAMLQALLVAVYTGLLAPVVGAMLKPFQRWLVENPTGRDRR